jgi:hypothetical protein
MSAQRIAAVTIIAGSLVFLIGAAIGVPRVFTTTDPDARLRLLQNGITSWRLAQPLYGLGPLLVAAGAVILTVDAATRRTSVAFAVASLSLFVGVLAWGWSLYLRGTRVAEFAHGTLPSWPFTTYVLLTIFGLAAIGLGLLVAPHPPWLGWLTIAASIAFLIAYLWWKDIPPFVFYVLTLVVAAALWKPR